jgi:hypothetical protein
MASNSIIEVRIGAPDNVLEVEVGTVEVDVLRSVGYYGGLAVAVGIGLIEPPLALFIAAVSVFKVLTNTVPVRDWPPVNITHVAFRLMVGAGAEAGGRAELVERGHVDLVWSNPHRPGRPSQAGSASMIRCR